MNQTKHTPGPWAWRRFGDTYTLHADHGRRETIIGAIPHGEMKYPVVAMSIAGRLADIDPDHPNAKLLKAAPDLLKALQDIIRLAEHGIEPCVNNSRPEDRPGHRDGLQSLVDFAAEAIKKATI